MSNMKLTPAERLKMALNHKEPDRIPLDLGSTKMSGISIKAYKNFIQYKGWQDIDGSPQILDPVQQLALVNEDILGEICVDTRGLLPCSPAGFKTEYKEVENYIVFKDEWGIDWRMPKQNGFYFDAYTHPLAGDISVSDLQKYPWPDPKDITRISSFKSRIEQLGKKDDYGFVLHGVTSGVMEMSMRLRGFEQMFMDFALDPDLACALLDKIVEIKCSYWEKALELVGNDVLVAVEADDLGTQNSLLISPQMYREFVKPRHKELFAFIRKKAPHIKIFLHSCGAIKSMIPDLVEAGVDILNPVQVAASGMDTKVLKKEFGDSLTFWGGAVDTQYILPFGTPDQVKDEVKRRIDDLAPGGGFVFNTIHNIQADVPPQNLEAMFDTLYKYWKYDSDEMQY